MYNQPSTVGMGKSRYTARHTSGLLQVAREESLDPDHALKANESIYIKRPVENSRQVIRSVIGLLGEDAVIRASELLHVSVLQPETAFRLRPQGRTLRSLTISAKQVAPQLSHPMTVEFDRIASYPSREGDQTLYSLTYDHTEPAELDIETETVIRRLGEVCGYHGTFDYVHDPHITIAIEAKDPPKYEEYMLDQPVTAILARAAFFARRLA